MNKEEIDMVVDLYYDLLKDIREQEIFCVQELESIRKRKSQIEDLCKMISQTIDPTHE